MPSTNRQGEMFDGLPGWYPLPSEPWLEATPHEKIIKKVWLDWPDNWISIVFLCLWFILIPGMCSQNQPPHSSNTFPSSVSDMGSGLSLSLVFGGTKFPKSLKWKVRSLFRSRKEPSSPRYFPTPQGSLHRQLVHWCQCWQRQPWERCWALCSCWSHWCRSEKWVFSESCWPPL